MMKKRLSKTLWYGSDIDKEGKPVLPPLAEEANDLEGIHEGELYLHLGDGSALLFTRSADGQVVQLGSNADELANYLLKSVWDKAFEFRVTETGEEYLFGKLNFATQYGITMYANGGLLDLPNIFEGIPFDKKTIWLNPETKLVEVIGSTEEDEGGSADFNNVKESGEGNSFTSFILSEDGKELTFVKGETFAKQSDFAALNTKVADFLEGSDTDNIINKWKELEAFLSGMKESDDLATILATKWTKDDAKIANWDAAFGWGDHSKAGYMKKSVIYDESIGCWKLDGDLLVTGGITMYANEGKYTPSTIMDGVRVDYDTIIVNENGELSINPDIELGGGGGFDADTIDGVDSSKLFVAQRETINRNNLDVFKLRDSGSVQVMRYKSSGEVIDASPLYTFRSQGSYLGFELFQEYNASGPVYKMRSIKDKTEEFTPWKTIAFEESLSDTFLPLEGGKMSGHIYMGGAKENSSTSNSSQLVFGTSENEHVAISSNSDAVIINPSSTSTDGQVILGVNGKASEFTGGEVKVGDISIKRNANGVLYIGGNLVVSGGITMYGTDGTTANTIWDNAPIANTNGKKGVASYDPSFFAVENGVVKFIGAVGGGGIDSITSQMVIDALGFTPYDEDNPNGYVTSAGSVAYATSAGSAQKDGDGSVISSTYLLRKNGTVSGSLYFTGDAYAIYASNNTLVLKTYSLFNLYQGDTVRMKMNASGTFSMNQILPISNGGASLGSSSYRWANLYASGGTLSSSGDLTVNGGITMYSDLRKKTILNHVELSLKEVADAPLIEHYYNSDEKKTTHVGSVAQYWAGLNDWFCKKDEEGFFTMEIQNAALASAISVARELTRYESKTDKQIKKLKKRIGELEEEIENLKKV